MRPGPTACFVTAGEVISTFVSSSLKTRSPAAIADCRMLYFSLRCVIGRKKRCAYCMKATSTPSDITLCTTWTVRRLFQEKPMARVDTEARCRIPLPPNQMMLATAIDDRISTTRSEEHTSELQSLRHLLCRLLLE